MLVLTLPGGVHSAQGGELTASDRDVNNLFGYSLSVSGNTAVVGAYIDGDKGNYSGSAYVFRNLDGTPTQEAKLTADDGEAMDFFSISVSVSGNTAVVGAHGKNSASGAAYVFRNLDSTPTQVAKLTANAVTAGDSFGGSVSVSGNTAVVGAGGDDEKGERAGSAYVFRNLDGTPTQEAKLTADDGVAGDIFGGSVSISGNTAVVGAYAKSGTSGAVYVFRNLDGTPTQEAKLTASDGAIGDAFGVSVSVSGNTTVVGAHGKDDASGAAYVFRNLDGTPTQEAKLTASDGEAGDAFGFSVSVSGNTAVVGALRDNAKGDSSGSAYVFRNLDGTPTQAAKLTASDGAANDSFGVSVSIDGDNFLIGAYGNDSNSGKAYSGSISSITTLDEGNASRTISGISFVSQEDWIVGQETSNNSVFLSAGDTAEITATNKAVYIGQNAGSNSNTLTIAGNLVASEVTIGSIEGNSGNRLILESTADFQNTTFRLALGNFLVIEDNLLAFSDILDFLDTATLQVGEADTWTTVTELNYSGLISFNSDGTETYLHVVDVIPEPGTYALLFSGAAAWLLFRRRKQ